MRDHRSNTGSLVAGAILVLLGLLFLLAEVARFDFWGVLWPVAVIGAGALFFVGMLAGGRSAAGLAIPGSIVATIGLILLFQQRTGNYQSWAYAWALIVAAVGAGNFIAGAWGGRPAQRRAGWRLARVGLTLFVVFGAFFELLIFRRQGLAEYVFPILLIGLGLYLLVVRSGLLPGRPIAPAPLAAPLAVPDERRAVVPAESAPPAADSEPARPSTGG